MDSAITFTDLALQSSITYNRANLSAIDRNAPLAFLDWVKNFANISSDPVFLLNEYKKYINKWFDVTNSSFSSNQDIIRELYVSLFRNIAINYVTTEERRFIQNLDVNNPSELAVVLPLLVRKIKDVCLHYASLRDKTKAAVYDYNLKGSEHSIKRLVYDELILSFVDPTINKLFTAAGIDRDTIKTQLNIMFEEHYDMETNYFDTNSQLPASAYEATGDRAEMFAANSYPFDPNLFVDFDTSVVSAIEKYPVILQELGDNFSVNLNFTSDDLQYLKDQDYINLVNNLDASNLNLNTLKSALQQFSGSTFYYLSTNADLKFSYDKLFDADHFTDYLNRRFPTVAMVQSDKIVPEKHVGRFFRPDKLGILNFLGFNVHGTVTSLSADTIYVFPDPTIYGNISGLSRTKFPTPFTFTESVDGLKCNLTNTYRFGEAISDFLTKYKGYQSRSESLNWDPTGPSRLQDPVDFFTGAQRLDWANSDVFPPDTQEVLPIDKRQATLLNTNKVLFQHRSDVYNNEYSLYKEVYKFDDPKALYYKENGEALTCLTLRGHVFYDSVSAYDFDFSEENEALNYSGVTLNTNDSITATNFDIILKSVDLYPELDWYKTSNEFVVTYYNGYTFIEIPTPGTDIYELGDFSQPDPFTLNIQDRPHVYMDSGPFYINGVLTLPAVFNDNFTVQNNLVGETLVNAETQLQDAVGTLSADVSLYAQHDVYGELYYRNYNSSIIEPASAALSGMFIKYPGIVSEEVFNNTKNIDVILDTLVIETESYMIFEKINYVQSKYQFLNYPVEQNYIARGNNHNFCCFSNIWFDVGDQAIYVAVTNMDNTQTWLHDKTIYFDMYKYDFDNIHKLTISSDLSAFSLGNTSLSATAVVLVERPILHYCPEVDTYTLKFLVKDVSNMFYHVDTTFSIDNYETIYNLAVTVLTPDMYLFSENFEGNQFSPIAETMYLNAPGSMISINNNQLVIH